MKPLSQDGRATLIYCTFAGCGPILTGLVFWAMQVSVHYGQWKTFAHLSYAVAASLFTVVTALGMYVSIRAIKVGKNGFEASGGSSGQATV